MRERMQGPDDEATQRLLRYFEKVKPDWTVSQVLGENARPLKPDAHEIEHLNRIRSSIRDNERVLTNLAATVDDFLGPSITMKEFLRRHPYGTSAYKASDLRKSKLFPNPQTTWGIDQPLWVSGRPSIALDYAQDLRSPVLMAFDRKDSKALRTGKTFFTPHVSKSNKRVRLQMMRDGRLYSEFPRVGDMFKDYEAVLPGHEARGLPRTVYSIENGPFIYGLSETPESLFSQIPRTFREIKDRNSYYGYAAAKNRATDSLNRYREELFNAGRQGRNYIPSNADLRQQLYIWDHSRWTRLLRKLRRILSFHR